MYTPEQLLRREASPWTKVQVILAPIQFVAFLISLSLVIRYLLSNHDEQAYFIASISVWVKITLIWALTITGMFWEKDVFDHYFMAKEFFWEDFGNLVAIITHNAYFVAQGLHWPPNQIMLVMLFAYLTYLFNAGQFVARGIQSAQYRGKLRAQALGKLAEPKLNGQTET
jgi:3-vinyl bacteriochlorophyllide hydratase